MRNAVARFADFNCTNIYILRLVQIGPQERFADIAFAYVYVLLLDRKMDLRRNFASHPIFWEIFEDGSLSQINFRGCIWPSSYH